MADSQRKTIDPQLLQYCQSPQQARALQAVIDHGGYRAAGKALGMQHSNIVAQVRRVEGYAARQGYAPDHDLTHPVAPGQILRGASTLYDADGNQRLQWVKSSASHEQMLEIMKDALDALSSDLPREPAVSPPEYTSPELANLYVITDYHLGMLSWHEETGDDWDMQIAEDLLVGWFASAIQLSPSAQVGILGQLGDMLHWDGLDAVTPANRHILDADTRFQKVVRVAIRAFRRVVRMLLEKHDQVHIIMAEGNHDPASSIWLREWMAEIYADEPRVSVDRSADPYYCYEWGQTSLFFHHGHKRRPSNVSDVFASKFREVFGRTKHSYGHLGHMHHIDQKENNLMVVEQHRTLAASDAYASRGGWMSGRSASCITYHKQYGEVGRISITPDMVTQP